MVTVSIAKPSYQWPNVFTSPNHNAPSSAPIESLLIEAVLAQCRGRVSGPAGAAAKLGMPRSTLESKIRSLQIHKQRFKTA